MASKQTKEGKKVEKYLSFGILFLIPRIFKFRRFYNMWLS